MGDGTSKRGFSEPTFIGGGVILDRDSQTYVPYRWVDGVMVLGEPQPFPADEAGMVRLQSMIDGRYKPESSGR